MFGINFFNLDEQDNWFLNLLDDDDDEENDKIKNNWFLNYALYKILATKCLKK